MAWKIVENEHWIIVRRGSAVIAELPVSDTNRRIANFVIEACNIRESHARPEEVIGKSGEKKQ